MVLDVLKPLQHKRLLEYELEGFGIRLNKSPPNIGYRPKDKGGVNLNVLVIIHLAKISMKFRFFLWRNVSENSASFW